MRRAKCRLSILLLCVYFAASGAGQDLSMQVLQRDPRSPGRPYGSGAKRLEVDAGQKVGTIRSLLGVNRGPLAFPRDVPGEPISFIDSYRALGIDFIRTHDFYGPTDWQVIFPDWRADPQDPQSYDFRSSDLRVRAIAENGFQCLYRLGTSWRGREMRPINDPPGTIRDSQGRVLHAADSEDFQKWGQIAAHIVRHYTQGWKQGFRFPIVYWEIWNEPDLAEQFWTGTPEQYYVLYEEAARAVKSVNPALKVGGPACTGGFRAPYVEGFIRACQERRIPLDFFSWHSYGGRDAFNPCQYEQDARRIRKILDAHGFTRAENLCTEWNAGIQKRLFSHTPAGAAFYASTLASFLNAGVDHAFQYCGDRHPGLGLHEMRDGRPKICAYSFQAWKQLLGTPERLSCEGSDARGYAVVAGRDSSRKRIQVLISDFQSGHDSFELRVSHLPWRKSATFRLRWWLLDATHRLDLMEEVTGQGPELTFRRPFGPGSVCLIEVVSAK